jgi:hypothetical protein
MKAIILISSFFYILGLIISNKIEIIKSVNPVEKIISNTISATKSVKSIHFNDARDDEAEVKTEADSIKNSTVKVAEPEKDNKNL